MKKLGLIPPLHPPLSPSTSPSDVNFRHGNRSSATVHLQPFICNRSSATVHLQPFICNRSSATVHLRCLAGFRWGMERRLSVMTIISRPLWHFRSRKTSERSLRKITCWTCLTPLASLDINQSSNCKTHIFGQIRLRDY